MDRRDNKTNSEASGSSDEGIGSGRGSCERIIGDGDFGDGDASGSRAKRRVEKEQAEAGAHVSHLPLSPP